MMFLYRKYQYTVKELETTQDLDDMITLFRSMDVNYAGFDTETNGLDIMQSVPFLFVFGFGKNLYSLDLTGNKEFINDALFIIYKDIC